jgi:hypothetical protein
MRSVIACASVFLCGLACAQTPQVGSAPPGSRPKVICRPCGEVPPPKGYGCSDGVMVADSVPTSEIAKEAAVCKQGSAAKNTNDSGKKKKPAKPHPEVPGS